MGYKAIGARRITDYIYSFPGSVVGVEDITQNVGVNKLRVYPALLESERAGYTEIVEREELGAPLAVRKKGDAS